MLLQEEREQQMLEDRARQVRHRREEIRTHFLNVRFRPPCRCPECLVSLLLVDPQLACDVAKASPEYRWW
jgi:hypothetical protein